MNSKALLATSVFADFLDFGVIGQIPGVGHFLDIPVFIMHFLAGGPKAAMVLLEVLPGVGFMPIYTYFAWKYHKNGVYEY